MSPTPRRSTRVRCSASSFGSVTVSSPGSRVGVKNRCTSRIIRTAAAFHHEDTKKHEGHEFLFYKSVRVLRGSCLRDMQVVLTAILCAHVLPRSDRREVQDSLDYWQRRFWHGVPGRRHV